MSDPVRITPWWDPQDQGNYRSLIWNLTRKCNRNCQYCPFHDDISPVLSNQQLIHIARQIAEQFNRASQKEEIGYKQVVLFGGEPTTLDYSTLLTCVAILSTVRPDIVLYTNMSGRTVHYAGLVAAGVTNIMGSYHSVSNAHYTAYCNKLKELEEYKLTPYVHYLLMEDACKVELFAEKLKEAGVAYDMFKPHRDGVKADRPTDDTVVDIEGWKKLVHNNKNCFTGWSCAAGRLHAYIECNGDVYPCQGIGHACYTGKLNRKTFSHGNLLAGDCAPLWQDIGITACINKACRFEVGITKYKPA